MYLENPIVDYLFFALNVSALMFLRAKQAKEHELYRQERRDCSCTSHFWWVYHLAVRQDNVNRSPNRSQPNSHPPSTAHPEF